MEHGPFKNAPSDAASEDDVWTPRSGISLRDAIAARVKKMEEADEKKDRGAAKMLNGNQLARGDARKPLTQSPARPSEPLPMAAIRSRPTDGFWWEK